MSDEKLPPGNGKLAKFLSLITCLLIGGGVWFQLLRDEEPVPVPAELAGTPAPTVPDEENRLLFLSASLNERKWPLSNPAQMEILQGHKPWDMAAMQSLLEAAADLKTRVEVAVAERGGARVLRQPARGYGSAMRHGMAAARAEWVGPAEANIQGLRSCRKSWPRKVVSDIKNVSYFYNHRAFEKIVKEGSLKN